MLRQMAASPGGLAEWLGQLVRWLGGLAAWFRRLAEGRYRAAVCRARAGERVRREDEWLLCGCVGAKIIR